MGLHAPFGLLLIYFAILVNIYDLATDFCLFGIGNLLFAIIMYLFIIFQIEWYNRCLDVLNNIETLYQGKDTADIIQSKVLQVDFFVCHLLIVGKHISVSTILSAFPLNKNS